MGYTTDFEGKFKFNKPLDIETFNFLRKLNETRRMARNVGPEYGVEGEFYVDGGGMAGQDNEDNIIDYNTPPKTQPGLWCQWVPTEDGKYLEWDGGEKFYYYVEWLQYIIDKILKPRKYKLSGEVEWQGEDSSDFGKIVVKNNVITTKQGRKTYDWLDFKLKVYYIWTLVLWLTDYQFFSNRAVQCDI